MPNKDFIRTKYKVICYKHWPTTVRKRKIRGGSEVPIDPPTVFEGVPPSCMPTPVETKARNPNTSLTLRNSNPDEMDAFDRQDLINWTSCVDRIAELCPDTPRTRTDSELCVLSASRDGNVRTFSVYIDRHYDYQCYFYVRKITLPFVNDKINRYSQNAGRNTLCTQLRSGR